MSNENEFVASVNRLESLIDSNHTDLKREVESLIDRRFGSLKEEVNKLKCAQFALDQINNLMALWDDRRHLSDLPNRIRHILEGVTVNNQNQTHHLVSSEVGDNFTVENSVNNLGGNEFRTEEHVNSLDTNVPLPSTVNDINSSTSDNEQVNYLSTVEPISCSVSTINVPASSSIIHTNIKTEDASNSQQSVQMCKRVKLEDGQYITDSDSDSDSDCDECIYGIVKQEVKEEFVETCQLDRSNGQSVQLGTQVKKEEETSDQENVEVQVAINGREKLNRNDDLHEESNGTNQGSLNDQQVDKGDHGPSEPANNGQNESPITKQSKTRKRKRTATRISDVSSLGPMTNSKRTRESSPLDRTDETVEKVSTALAVDWNEMDEQNGNDSSGDVEQNEDEETWSDSETELGDEDDGGHYKIEIVKLICTEDGCEDEVASTVELHDHLRDCHNISSSYRCLARECLERFEKLGELGRHVRHIHSNISTWPCPHCTKAFKSQTRLYKHLYIYHFKGQFKCGYDGCYFDRVATLRSEIFSHQCSVHPKSTIYTCQFNNCGKSFNNKGQFNRHQPIHTRVKPFRCGWIGCRKSFTQKGHLDVHLRIHQKVKPYKCTWNKCDYASTDQSNAIRHIRTQHFNLPASKKAQYQLDIEDNRSPHDYLLNTTQPI